MRIVVAPALAAALFLIPGCWQPLREGPQVPSRPAGFVYQANVSKAALLFPDRERVRQLGYFRPGEPGGSIVITQYAGAVDVHDTRRARRRMAQKYSWEEYGVFEYLEVDHRTAWGWTEIQRRDGQTFGIGYTAVVPYERTTYTIEFYTDDPALFDPDAQRQYVTTFVVAGR